MGIKPACRHWCATRNKGAHGLGFLQDRGDRRRPDRGACRRLDLADARRPGRALRRGIAVQGRQSPPRSLQPRPGRHRRRLCDASRRAGGPRRRGGRRPPRPRPPVRAGAAGCRGAGLRPAPPTGLMLSVRADRPRALRLPAGGVARLGLRRPRRLRARHRDPPSEPGPRRQPRPRDGSGRHHRASDHRHHELLHRRRCRPGRHQPARLARRRGVHRAARRRRRAARVRRADHRHPPRRALRVQLRRPDRLDEDEPGNRRHAGDRGQRDRGAGRAPGRSPCC